MCSNVRIKFGMFWEKTRMFMLFKLLRWISLFSINMSTSNKHVNLQDVEKYIRNGQYPTNIKKKGAKSNFRKSCKHFSIVHGHLTFKGTRKVIFENERKQAIIHDVHEGINETVLHCETVFFFFRSFLTLLHVLKYFLFRLFCWWQITLFILCRNNFSPFHSFISHIDFAFNQIL